MIIILIIIIIVTVFNRTIIVIVFGCEGQLMISFNVLSFSSFSVICFAFSFFHCFFLFSFLFFKKNVLGARVRHKSRANANS